jgi:hypothetical protein
MERTHTENTHSLQSGSQPFYQRLEINFLPLKLREILTHFDRELVIPSLYACGKDSNLDIPERECETMTRNHKRYDHGIRQILLGGSTLLRSGLCHLIENTHHFR